MERKKISSNTIWEKFVGYSRAVKVGKFIYVSGTTSMDENGKIVGQNDVYSQAKFIFSKIEKSLKEAGSGLKDVVRTRMYVINIDDWEKIGQAHGEIFKDIKPASTMVEVSKLIDKEHLIEIEAEAIID